MRGADDSRCPKKLLLIAESTSDTADVTPEVWDDQAGKFSAAFHLGGFDILHHFDPFSLSQQLSDMIFFFFFIISFAKSSSGRQTLHNREALVSLFTLLLLCEKQGYSQLNWLYRSVEVTFTNQQLQINTLH